MKKMAAITKYGRLKKIYENAPPETFFQGQNAGSSG
jgi:hypothetical protein